MDRPRQTETMQRGFYEAVLVSTQNAEAATATELVRLTVAEVRVDLVFAGARMKDAMLPALQHLVTTSTAAPSAVLHVWDGSSTGIRMPPPPCQRHDFTDRGDIWGFTSTRYKTAFHWNDYSVNCFDVETGVGVYWVQSADALPYWAKASPLRTLLHWTLERSGAQLLHAAAVGNENGAVLITAKGGAGKSSTALAALERGMQYIGDDYLAVRLDPEPSVYSLYSTAKLNAEDVVHFPRLAGLVRNLPSVGGEKAVLQLYPELQAQIVTRMPLKAVLTPRVTASAATQLAPADAVRLARAAAFTTLSQLPYAGQRTQGFIESLVERLPGAELQLGSDRAAVVECLREALSWPETAWRALSMRRRDTESQPALPLVSVIMPVYNGAKFLNEAVRCVLAQNYPSLEIIVVDDGSTDDVEQVVARLPVDVRFFRQENAGPAAARNRGIRDASGPLVAFLDVDDLWPEGTLSTLASTLHASPSLMVVHGHAQMMVLDPATGAFNPEGNPAESFPYYIGAALYRREAFEAVGLFDVSLRFGEDTDWYTRLREQRLEIERLPRVTLQVRRHGGNMTAGKTPEQMSATGLGPFRKALERARRGGIQAGTLVRGRLR